MPEWVRNRCTNTSFGLLVVGCVGCVGPTHSSRSIRRHQPDVLRRAVHRQVSNPSGPAGQLVKKMGRGSFGPCSNNFTSNRLWLQGSSCRFGSKAIIVVIVSSLVMQSRLARCVYTIRFSLKNLLMVEITNLLLANVSNNHQPWPAWNQVVIHPQDRGE